MTTALLIGIVAAISAASGLVTLAGMRAQGSFLYAYSPPRRILFGILLLTIGITAGLLAARQAMTADRSQTHHTTGATEAKAPVIGTTAAPLPITTTTASLSTELRSTPGPAKEPPRTHVFPTQIVIRDETNHADAFLTAAARQILIDKLNLEGSVRTATMPPDEHLQGIITSTMTLTVTITNGDHHIVNTFELQAVGGGFTADAAVRQARTRLKEQLTERLQEYR